MADPVETTQFVEIFHSKPSWTKAYIQFRLPSGGWANPRDAPLVYAEHIRERFRVYRTKFTGEQLQFVVTNGSQRNWDAPPDGSEFYCIDQPGRYVVEHNIRRVGDADREECVRALVHHNDCHVTISFVADLWEKCFCAYAADAGDWIPAPGKEMRLMETTPRKFSVTIKAKSLVFAFNSGGEDPVWDSNQGENFKVGLPGKYHVADGIVHFLGRSEADLAPDGKSGVAANGPSSAAHTTAASAIKS